jgi:hypothetical protein
MGEPGWNCAGSATAAAIRAAGIADALGAAGAAASIAGQPCTVMT